jgi:hypothetical protein
MKIEKKNSVKRKLAESCNGKFLGSESSEEDKLSKGEKIL